MKSQPETDTEILSTVKQQDNELENINVRNTSSTHSIDCNCPVCKPLQFDGAVGENKENELKETLDYFDETKL